MGILKVSCSPATMVEQKGAIRWTIGGINSNMLNSALIDRVTQLACLIPCGGGHVGHPLPENKYIVLCYCDLLHLSLCLPDLHKMSQYDECLLSVAF
ncbi:hypothetical protein CDAR_320911 [Caerostris darwini]|uniref:Uncharacterized protein n=1 Tax=Caerostris darwini TaxID=1538125 RepID=A0AAV4WYU4_9ARAC|nr:hypothetical protein CDAR_320911 [Caerostris darwini]